MFGLKGRQGSVLAMVVVSVVLGGCGSKTVLNPAPVEDRAAGGGKSSVPVLLAVFSARCWHALATVSR